MAPHVITHTQWPNGWARKNYNIMVPCFIAWLIACKIKVFHQIWELLRYYFFQCFVISFSSPGTHYIDWYSWWRSTGLWAPFISASFSFLYVPRLNNVNLTHPQLYLFSLLPVQICSWVNAEAKYLLLNIRISFGSFKLFLFIYWYSLFGETYPFSHFHYLDMVSLFLITYFNS